MKSRLAFSTIIWLVSGVTATSCYGFEGQETSKDHNLTVIYKVEDGYKVSVTIDTKKKKSVYKSFEKSDVSNIHVVFVDANQDGYLDVIIQHADETGYVPVMLINHGNLSFTDALMDAKKQFSTAIYVDTEVELLEESGRRSGGSYELKDMNGDGAPELVFYNTFIDGKGYRYVAFQFDRKTKSYHLFKKGKFFAEQ